MADKKNAGADGGDRNVDQIRDILFGGQMRDYERRFVELAAKLENEGTKLRAEMEKRLAALDKRLDDQVEKLAKAVRQEVTDRGKAVDDLDGRTLQAARTARAEINAAFDDVHQEMSSADERSRKALADLASQLKAAIKEADAALTAARGELRGEKVGREDLAALLTEVSLRLKGEFDLPAGKKG